MGVLNKLFKSDCEGLIEAYLQTYRKVRNAPRFQLAAELFEEEFKMPKEFHYVNTVVAARRYNQYQTEEVMGLFMEYINDHIKRTNNLNETQLLIALILAAHKIEAGINANQNFPEIAAKYIARYFGRHELKKNIDIRSLDYMLSEASKAPQQSPDEQLKQMEENIQSILNSYSFSPRSERSIRLILQHLMMQQMLMPLDDYGCWYPEGTDRFSLGYILGFSFAICKDQGIEYVDDEIFEIIPAVFIGLFAEDDKELYDTAISLNGKKDSKFMSGYNAGVKDYVDFIKFQSEGLPKSTFGWVSYVRERVD
jgi:hypothetical protein